jgi:hypothetical protein
VKGLQHLHIVFFLRGRHLDPDIVERILDMFIGDRVRAGTRSATLVIQRIRLATYLEMVVKRTDIFNKRLSRVGYTIKGGKRQGRADGYYARVLFATIPMQSIGYTTARSIPLTHCVRSTQSERVPTGTTSIVAVMAITRMPMGLFGLARGQLANSTDNIVLQASSRLPVIRPSPYRATIVFMAPPGHKGISVELRLRHLRSIDKLLISLLLILSS